MTLDPAGVARVTRTRSEGPAGPRFTRTKAGGLPGSGWVTLQPRGRLHDNVFFAHLRIDHLSPALKSFIAIADALSRNGIVVLRIDDRGAGGSSGQKQLSSVQQLAGDLVAGVAFLKTRPEANPRRIGIIGHSFAGLTAPMAAVRSLGGSLFQNPNLRSAWGFGSFALSTRRSGTFGRSLTPEFCG